MDNRLSMGDFKMIAWRWHGEKRVCVVVFDFDVMTLAEASKMLGVEVRICDGVPLMHTSKGVLAYHWMNADRERETWLFSDAL